MSAVARSPLAEEVKRKRKARGFKRQDQLADEANVAREVVHRIENDLNVRVSSLRAVLTTLGIPAESYADAHRLLGNDAPEEKVIAWRRAYREDTAARSTLDFIASRFGLDAPESAAQTAGAPASPPETSPRKPGSKKPRQKQTRTQKKRN